MTHQEEHICIHYEMGAAFAIWAEVENTILQVLFAVLPKNTHYKVGVGFLSIENFRSKVAFANAIMHESKLSKTRLAKWETISDRLVSASVKRNKLAHGRVYVYPVGAEGRRFGIGSWTLLKEPAKNQKAIPGQVLCLRDVIGIKHDFLALVATLSRFSSLLGKEKSLIPASAEQPAPIPAIPAIRNRIRAAFQ